ncbi:hypothetical protein AB1Y20_016772 [Prymnesium parvum]|uniref:Exostosin GT47 domain-containing protein n=1 Tax=Prymnesium parvum TaxID=97485 RepID=A0AB34IC15_PRYPA
MRGAPLPPPRPWRAPHTRGAPPPQSSTSATWRRVSSSPPSLGTPPRFFLYDSPPLNHSRLLRCAGDAWRYDDSAAEVPMLRLLARHPARTLDPSSASLFILAVLPHLSHAVRSCGGDAHAARMDAAAAALRASPHFRKRGGADHLVVTNSFRLAALGALREAMANGSVAWFELPSGARMGPHRVHELATWRCTVVIPYLSNPYCPSVASYRHNSSSSSFHSLSPSSPSSSSSSSLSSSSSSSSSLSSSSLSSSSSSSSSLSSSSPSLSSSSPSPSSSSSSPSSLSPSPRASIFFQGSVEAGRSVRAAVLRLRTYPGADIANASRERILAVARGGTDPLVPRRYSPLGTALRMANADFCLVPKGDTPTSSRLYSALACGCVPLIVSNDFKPHQPFPHVLPPSRHFWNLGLPKLASHANASEALRVPRPLWIREAQFIAGPAKQLDVKLRGPAGLAAHLPRLRRALEDLSVDLLYDAPGSRVAHNLLMEWKATCGGDERGELRLTRPQGRGDARARPEKTISKEGGRGRGRLQPRRQIR